ncbi:MAG: 6-bladed beta-propeller [Bacteroidota bacterium]
MKFNLQSIILIAVTLIGCEYTNERENVYSEKIVHIPENEEIIYASRIISEMKMVELEKTQESLVGEIVKIELSEEKLFIQGKNYEGIKIFNSDGTFNKTFSNKGKGPGEYIEIQDFIIDSGRNTIEILDKKNNQIFVYDLRNYEFIESFPIPVQFAFKFVKQDNIYYFQTNGTQNKVNEKPTHSAIIAFNKNTLELIPLFKDETQTSNQFLEFSNIFYISNDSEIFASFAWKQEIYHIYNQNCFPLIVIDPGDRGFPETILEGTPDDKLKYIFSDESKNKIGGFRLLFYKNGSFILAYGKGNSMNQYLYFSYADGKDTFAAKKVINDLSPIPLPDISIHKVIGNDIISIIYPHEIEDQEILINLGISEGDNPILIKYKLKS